VNFIYNDVEHFKTRKDLDAFNCNENICKKNKENSIVLYLELERGTWRPTSAYGCGFASLSDIPSGTSSYSK